MFSDFLHRHHKQRLLQCREWFVVHRHRLLAYARQQVDSSADVELLLADTLRKVTRVFCEGGLDEDKLMSYTLSALHHAAVDIREKDKKRMLAEQKFGEGERDFQRLQDAPSGEPADTYDGLRRAIGQLAGQHATILMLKLWEGLSFSEIARLESLSESTVRRRYAEALEQVKNIIEP